jgi:hypothetical protein
MKKKVCLLFLVIATILIAQSCHFFSHHLTRSETQGEEPISASDFKTQAQRDAEKLSAEKRAAEHKAMASVLLGAQKSSVFGGESWKDPVGVQAGIIVPFLNLSETMSLKAEANLSMQGAKWEEFDLKGRTNLLYINIPLVGRYQTKNGFFGEVGFQPGLLLSAKDKYEGTTDDYMDEMKKFDLSIPVGIGYEFKNNFGVGLRVIPGITDITKDEDEKDVNFVVALRGTYTFKK